MKHFSKISGLSLVSLALSVTTAFAAVSYDPATGGFVGKGNIQTVFGWNNHQLQQNASSLDFRYSDQVVTEGGSCLNPNTGAAHPNDIFIRTTGLESSVTYDLRQRNQVTGFNLSPVSSSSGSTVYTDTCSGNRVEGTPAIISVLPGAGLEVSADGTTWFSLPNSL